MNKTTSYASDYADEALSATKRTAQNVQQGVDELREAVPSALSRAAAQAEDLTRRGIERARNASTAVREQATMVGDRTVGYIKDEPMKSVLMAAAAGAAVALLVGWATRTRSERY